MVNSLIRKKVYNDHNHERSKNKIEAIFVTYAFTNPFQYMSMYSYYKHKDALEISHTESQRRSYYSTIFQPIILHILIRKLLQIFLNLSIADRVSQQCGGLSHCLRTIEPLNAGKRVTIKRQSYVPKLVQI